MSPRLPKQAIASRTDLERIGDGRLREAQALLEAGCSAGAVYLSGYSVECYLKAAICHRLEWDHLLGAFKTHDLEALLLYAGLARELENNDLVYENFREVVGLWNDRNGEVAVRYCDPNDIDETTARTFLNGVLDSREGLIPWLRKAIS